MIQFHIKARGYTFRWRARDMFWRGYNVTHPFWTWLGFQWWENK